MNSFKILNLACFICLAAVSTLAQPAQMQQPAGGPDKLVALADFYYRSNDISDAADRYYRQAIQRAPGSQASGLAQYNRGGYWFRKFYVVREQYSKDDRAALTEAEGQYYDFIDKFARQTNTIEFLADAEFYLALVYLQQGKREYAVGWLNRMLGEAVNKDQSVYVYKVVWSSKPGDIVDRKVDAAQLAMFARQAIVRTADVDSVILDIKRWCQRQ
jgi:tetratricopeptide (TPR) repeat protein